jgi:CRISPR/Cas system-associated endonuclease Cas1
MKALFLTGYGLSISIKNTRLVFKQGIKDPFSRNGEIIESTAGACPFDKVVIQGKGYVSTEALQILAENNINVVMLDKRGKLFGYFNQIRGSDPSIRQKQYDCFRDEARLEYLRKWIVKQKIESQIQLFKEIVARQYRHLVLNSYIVLKFEMAIDKMQTRLQGLERLHTLRDIACRELGLKNVLSNIGIGHQTGITLQY